MRVSEDGRVLENMTSNKIQQLATDEQVHEDVSYTKYTRGEKDLPVDVLIASPDGSTLCVPSGADLYIQTAYYIPIHRACSLAHEQFTDRHFSLG